jgi:aspartyl protease family protein
MKKMGRKHRPFFRMVAIDGRAPRDGKVIEELGHYDPLVKDTDARALLKGERISYWLSVGALPSENCAVLIKKYGANGSRLAEQQAAAAQKVLTQLRIQHTQLSAQLANIDPSDVTLNNKLVGALNAIRGQHDLGRQQTDKMDEQVKAARAKANEAREAYIQFILDARKLAGKIEADYTQKAADPEVKAAVARLNQATGKQFELAPSASFQSSLRRLKQLEDTVLSEAIDLRDDGGKTLRVSVVVNGKYQEEMVLDSGASLISLPSAIATKFGLKPTEKDPRITLQLADGREIEGRLMKLTSVRVGKFTVDNVECAVLGPEATMAEPLLGMSFLENFKFEIDAAAKKLNMVKVASSDAPPNKGSK